MTRQWALSGNAENVDWSDIAESGRAYADNLIGEPVISKVMHMMADEIDRLRLTNEEREAVKAAVDFCECTDKPLPRSEQIATLRGLLGRVGTA